MRRGKVLLTFLKRLATRVQADSYQYEYPRREAIAPSPQLHLPPRQKIASSQELRCQVSGSGLMRNQQFLARWPKHC
jgi:hypothetical protein